MPAAALLAALVLSGGAHASPEGAGPVTPGERLEWAVTWMGIAAGTAWSTAAADTDGLRYEAGCTSAPWLAGLYPVDDRLISTWRPASAAWPGGSSRYVTRFREGDFQQDTDAHLAGDPVVIARSQRFDEGWRTWEETRAAAPGVEDPVSAFYRLRGEAGPVGERVRFQVWNGRKPAWVQVWTAAEERVAGLEALRVEVLADHGGGDLEAKMTVWVTDDADRVPLLAEVRTRAGPVRATLARRVIE